MVMQTDEQAFNKACLELVAVAGMYVETRNEDGQEDPEAWGDLRSAYHEWLAALDRFRAEMKEEERGGPEPGPDDGPLRVMPVAGGYVGVRWDIPGEADDRGLLMTPDAAEELSRELLTTTRLLGAGAGGDAS